MTGKNDGFVKQAGILAVAGIICRIIGILYRSPLAAVIGDEGNGYYGSAYNIYAIILLVSSYSIPAAISKVIAGKIALKEYRNARRIFHCAFLYAIIVGGIASLFAYFGAPLLVEVNAVNVLRVLSPTIFFSGLLGVLRGYFQAQRNMVPTSVSQIIEQILNAIVSVGAAYILKQSVASHSETTQAIFGAMGSALGTGSGVLIGLAVMVFIYGKNRRKYLSYLEKDESRELMSKKEIFGVIFTFVTPFILSTFIYNFSTSLDEVIYRKILKLHYSVDISQIAVWYGVYSGKAVVISNIPVAISSAISAAMIPVISGKFATGNIESANKKINIAILSSMMIAVPCAFALGFLAKPVVSLLFPGQTNLDLAAGLLRALAVTVVFYSLSTLTNAVLQGIGKVNLPMHHAAISLVVQAVVLILCLRFTTLNLYSLVIANIVYSMMMCILNQIAVAKALGYKQEIKRTFLLPIWASLLMAAQARFAYDVVYRYLHSNLLGIVFAGGLGLLIYEILIIRTGIVTEETLRSIPKGEILIKISKKLKLIREDNEKGNSNTAK